MPFTKFKDMAQSPEQQIEAINPAISEHPQYPYGLRICLTHAELEKFGMEADCDVGDTINIRALGEVTSVTKEGGRCRVEIQIQKMAIESEDEEDD